MDSARFLINTFLLIILTDIDMCYIDNSVMNCMSSMSGFVLTLGVL